MWRLEPNMTQWIQVAAGVHSQVHQNVGSSDLDRDMPAQQEAGTPRRVNRKPSKLWYVYLLFVCAGGVPDTGH